MEIRRSRRDVELVLRVADPLLELPAVGVDSPLSIRSSSA